MTVVFGATTGLFLIVAWIVASTAGMETQVGGSCGNGNWLPPMHVYEPSESKLMRKPVALLGGGTTPEGAGPVSSASCATIWPGL